MRNLVVNRTYGSAELWPNSSAEPNCSVRFGQRFQPNSSVRFGSAHLKIGFGSAELFIFAEPNRTFTNKT